ncbi:hypothetical protein Sviol_82140 [Streptomyces violascens]|uniref:Uncharacterized protein n=1 Tax=Streptomyces violascens TaxID=67381 RepID=A0ABQ3R2P5_9ACTN|nr:hypothetical protein Sviol_82140 [Streptomyces violascens]
MAAIAIFLSIRAGIAISEDQGNFLTTFDWNPAGSPPAFRHRVSCSSAPSSARSSRWPSAVPDRRRHRPVHLALRARKLAAPLAYVVDLLAAVPSIVYGIWGALFLVPYLGGLNEWLDSYLGWTVLFEKTEVGVARSIFTVGILLAIMILPDRDQRQPRGLPPGPAHERGGPPWPSARPAGKSSASRCCPSAARA